MLDRDREIDEALAEAVGRKSGSDDGFKSQVLRSMLRLRVRNILLLSTAYDYFLIEEEGRLSELMKGVYGQRDTGYIPTVRHVGTAERAISLVKGDWIDLVVVFNIPSDMGVLEFVSKAKAARPDLPVVFLANNTPELARIAADPGASAIDRIFTWHGDGAVFIAIVQYVEDKTNAEQDIGESGVQAVLLIEDSIHYYSLFVPAIYRMMWRHTEAYLAECQTFQERTLKLARTPVLLHAATFEEAQNIVSRFADSIACVVSDVDYPRGGELIKGVGYETLRTLRVKSPSTPVLILHSEEVPREVASSLGARAVEKSSPRLLTELEEHIGKMLGDGGLMFDVGGGAIIRVETMRDLENAIYAVPAESLVRPETTGAASRWLRGRVEFEMATAFDAAGSSSDPEEAKRRLVLELEKRKACFLNGAITSFSREDPAQRKGFARIGGGALGGKARGLAFMNKIFATHLAEEVIPGVRFFIPRTVVLSTDVFDQFIEVNGFSSMDTRRMPDDRIASAFLQAQLPPVALGDVRALAKECRTPMIVRSSSLLEDALFQPFAGVYASVLLPNASLETDSRFRALSEAIKFVYASAFMERARSYISATPNRPEDEKMGVVIQEVVGERRGDIFLPAISGVARSFDCYPFGSCLNTDGVATLAFGLGKAIVDGGKTHQFCPQHPRVIRHGTTKEMMSQSQSSFFAIDLTATRTLSGMEEDSSLTELPISWADERGMLGAVASTYSAANDRLYPGTEREGPKVVNFAPLLHERNPPLARAVRLLLRLGEVALGCPVEIEFAVNLKEDGRSMDFGFLQVRAIVGRGSQACEVLDSYPAERLLGRTSKALGDGTYSGIRDIVMVRDNFEMEHSQEAVERISKLNASMVAKGRPYLLSGPGRWGSSDPWLGIPVVWSDIAGARVILETPVGARIIEPSQGSHFFQNMRSLRVAYLTMGPVEMNSLDAHWLSSLPVVSEDEILVHRRSHEPIEVRIDGRSGRGVLLKQATDPTKWTKEEEGQ